MISSYVPCSLDSVDQRYKCSCLGKTSSWSLHLTSSQGTCKGGRIKCKVTSLLWKSLCLHWDFPVVRVFIACPLSLSAKGGRYFFHWGVNWWSLSGHLFLKSFQELPVFQRTLSVRYYWLLDMKCVGENSKHDNTSSFFSLLIVTLSNSTPVKQG